MENSLAKRNLGQTDILVSPIGLGLMDFSGDRKAFSIVFPGIPHEQKNAIVKTCIDGGINWFDTAEMYGFGASERALATALKANGLNNGQVVVATKWFPLMRTARNISRNIHTRLRNLDRCPIDLLMVHLPYSLSSPEAEMNAMANLVQAGQIRSVGVSNFNLQRMLRAQAALERRGLSLAVNQMEYSLLNRKVETSGVMQAAKDLGVTIVAYTPLAAGVLTGKYHDDPTLLKKATSYQRYSFPRLIEESRPLIEAMRELAEKYNVSVAQIALNWVINFQGQTVVAIPGAKKVAQAEQNAGAMHFKLNEEDLARLDELSRAFR
jgi:aryl-alcohol dehydrogenase-like predicted oxidoreductase